MIPRNLPPRGNARRASTALLLGATALMLSACADHSTLAVADAVHIDRQFSLSLPEGMSLQCAPIPQVSQRAVALGTDADFNGNGIVCDEQLGQLGLPEGAAPSAIITIDDMPFPSNSTTSDSTP